MIRKLHICPTIVVLVLLISIAYSDTIKEFGFKTAGGDHSDSNSPTELTLQYNGDIYQCQVIPEDTATEYSCRGTRSKIGTGCGATNEIFIENTDYDTNQIDSVEVDYVFIIDENDVKTTYDVGDKCLDLHDCGNINAILLDLATEGITEFSGAGNSYSFTCTGLLFEAIFYLCSSANISWRSY